MKLFRYLLFIYFAGLLFTSCKDDNTIGAELLKKDQPLVNFVDTLTLNASSVKEDPLTASSNTYNLLGSYTDPVFGLTSASFYAQFLPASTSYSLGSTKLTLDSAAVELAYSGLYGDSTVTQTVSLFEVTQAMLVDSFYKSNKSFSINSTVGTTTYFPKKGSGNLPLHIGLNKTYASKLFSDLISDTLSHTSNGSNDIFKTKFNGFYFKPQTQAANGAISYFNLLSTFTKVTFYYHDGILPDQKTFTLVSTSSCARVNHFEHDNVKRDYLKGTNGNDQLYLQAMAGMKAKITFPSLTSLYKNGPIIINKAELIVPAITPNQTTFEKYLVEPTQLYAVGIDNTGTGFILDDQYQGAGYYDGAYGTVTKGEYHFNVALYLQKILNKKLDNNGLYLIVSAAAISANRVVVQGPKNAGSKLRIRITYTKL